MNPAHAPSEFLAAYTSGSLSDGMELLIASHLTFCPRCRDKVARLEALEGALLAEVEPAADMDASLAAVLARLDAAEDAAPTAAADLADPSEVLPAPLRRCLGSAAGEIRWRFVLPGISEYRLQGFTDEDVSLLRARPGVRVPAHTHSGREATLVLAGQLCDGDRVFGRGDLALSDQRHDHHPHIGGTEPCVCLIVQTGRIRFTGRFGRILNLLQG